MPWSEPDGARPVKLRDNLRSDVVSSLDQSVLVVVPPSATIREAIRLMRERRCGCVLVCEARRLCGIFTERDVLKRVLARDACLDGRVDAHMTPDPVTVRRDDGVALVIRRMLEGGYRHLPVVDDQGMPVGVVSVKGLIHYLNAYFPAAVYNLPPVPGQVHQTREGA